MNRLRGKRALITGGTTGIGLETARQFLLEGARVAITGRNPATLEVAREELGSEVLVIASDAGDAAAQKGVADRVRAAFGALDVLFVNAGVVEAKPVELPVFAKPASIVLNASVNAHIGCLIPPYTGRRRRRYFR